MSAIDSIPETPGAAGRAGPQSTTPRNLQDKLDDRADALIRRMIVEQKRDASREALPEIEREGGADAAPANTARRFPWQKQSKPAEATPQKPAREERAPVSRGATRRPSLGKLFSALPRLRIARWHVIAGAVLLICIFRPWLLPAIFFISLWVLLIAYLTLGPDRMAELVSGGWYRLHARRPALAEKLRRRADALALRLDALLDRLPEKWTAGLYLPDLSGPEEPDATRPDPFDRLAREVRRG